MSYDLAVFAPEAAPKTRVDFLAWFEQQTTWQEPHGYDDPVVSVPALRDWFLDMITGFPAMNGPYAPKGVSEDDLRLTDYSIGKSLIYVAFAWSKAETAFDTMFRLAEKHRVGFYNVSSSIGDVWLPDSSGKLVMAFQV